MDVEKVSDLVKEILKEKELTDCYLVEVIIGNTKIEVYLDSDEHVSYSVCKQLSRGLEEVLDDKKWFGEKYTLEVSSAGVGRPLLLNRQFKKNEGRKIDVKTVTGEKYSGTLEEVTDEHIKITWTVRERLEGRKKKVNVEKEAKVVFTDIEKAKIKVSF